MILGLLPAAGAWAKDDAAIKGETAARGQGEANEVSLERAEKSVAARRRNITGKRSARPRPAVNGSGTAAIPFNARLSMATLLPCVPGEDTVRVNVYGVPARQGNRGKVDIRRRHRRVFLLASRNIVEEAPHRHCSQGDSHCINRAASRPLIHRVSADGAIIEREIRQRERVRRRDREALSTTDPSVSMFAFTWMLFSGVPLAEKNGR